MLLANISRANNQKSKTDPEAPEKTSYTKQKSSRQANFPLWLYFLSKKVYKQKPASKVSTLYNLLPNRNLESSSNVATPSRNFEGAGNGEIKYEEQDFSNIISTTIF